MGGSTKVNLFSAVIFSWKRTWRTIRMLFQPEHHVLRGFMIAYFFFSDGYSTIINVGIIYAQTELNISTMWLGVILVEVVFFNMVGVRFYRWLFEERFSMRLQQALLILLYQYIAISVLAFLILQFGLIPLFFFGFSHGMLLGAVMATTRALFSSLVPHGLEAQFFALYAISDKGSSWIGPCVVAVMSQFASVRYGILWVVVALAVGAFILCRLPLDEVLAQKRKSQRTSSSYTRENAAPDQVGSSSAAE
ncbi:unnamed protein product [Amoebophrya sp. A25]|nr:unnamed protein product [Amoebophrya sp. A25]|eukprot:GSA25T00025136001.1